ncbi:hypothetical protein N7522_002430 [Penicillium canescens]|uniref:RanBD1 domain-containing protein n=1 Tax=Penicillium canescens TaxID=5083 RepID=A0AAD6N542_PENCN|nr:hypothetical protein N7522_002430 [Penicillium canescens]KAJ6030537.1 hypothetical protein N7460_010803 [Penicillium canescens]KAJ6154231.1 hypothetical protein N7485_012600 [Penicillium canescens]
MTPASLEQDPSAGALGTEPVNMESVTDGIAQSPCSDNDGGERPVRQQLKETNLDASVQKNVNKKRSHEEPDNDATSEADAPPKKRSRESTPETSSRSQDPSLQKNGSKKRSLNESDNDATSEADAPPKKRSRECTPEKSLGAQDHTSYKPSGAEQRETETAPAGTLSSNVSLSSLPDYEEPISPLYPVHPPLPAENPLETNESDAIPHGYVDVKSECGNDDRGERIYSHPDGDTTTPDFRSHLQAVVNMINLHNHNVEQGQVDGPDKDESTKIWVEGRQPSIAISLNAAPGTPKTPEARSDRWDLCSDAEVYHKTVHCVVTVNISIEGHTHIPVKVPFDINLSFQKPDPPQVPEQSNGSTASTCPSILRGCLVSTPDSRVHATYGHRQRYLDHAAQYPAPPSHISISSDEDTPGNDISSYISISSDEGSSHGDNLPSPHLTRTPERTTYAGPFGFEPISNTIFTQATEHPPATTEPTETKTVPPDGNLTTKGETEKINDLDERKTKINQTFSSSAFGNTSTDSPFTSAFKSSTTSTSAFRSSMASASATSPFTNLSATAKEPAPANSPSNTKKAASTSAFASSSLSAFAGSDDSPFGNLAAGTSTSVFGKPANSTGFSAFSSSFPATAKSGGLTSFASPNVTSSFGDSKAKAQPLGAKSQALGAAQSDNEDSDNEQEDEGNGNDTFVAEKTDKRFVEQPVETGEEDEETIFANKGKLYCFDKQWKERGIGTFKVNVKLGPDGKRTGRMIMRADGALRVMLNSAIFKGMHFGDQQGAPPAGRRIFLASKEDGKVANVLLQLNNENTVNELYAVLKDLMEED